MDNQDKSSNAGNEENWFNELPATVKEGINKSIKQADQGEFISYDEIKKELDALLKK